MMETCSSHSHNYSKAELIPAQHGFKKTTTKNASTDLGSARGGAFLQHSYTVSNASWFCS